MDLKSGYPYSAIKNSLTYAFARLEAILRCIVVVIGAGITGAQFADELAARGFDVVVLDQRDVGCGSTAASTALLQYEIDTHAIDLAKRYGEAQALPAYQACLTVIGNLQELAHSVGDVDVSLCASLYSASKQRGGQRVFDRTCVQACLASSRQVRLTTDQGINITAGHVVVACGYESQTWLHRRQSQQLRLHERLHRTPRSGLVGAYLAVGIGAA